ncbi:MAG: hypothetical protein ACP5IZ_05945 [Thermoprotei archaeon]|jgi:hypothetical protein
MLRKKLIILSVILIIIMLAIPMLPWTILSKGHGSIIFNLEFYDEHGRQYAGFFGTPAQPPNTRILAQITAIQPPNTQPTEIEIYRGEVKGTAIRIPAEGKILKTIESWIEYETNMRKETNPKALEVSIGLNLWIINTTTETVLQRVSQYYPYNPYKILEGHDRIHTVKIIIPPNRDNVHNPEPPQPLQCEYNYYYWELQWILVPENHTQTFGNNITFYNGAYFIKMPILMINNVYAGQDSPLGTSINIDVTTTSSVRFTGMIGIGYKVLDKVVGGDVSGGLTAYLGGPEWTNNVHFGKLIPSVNPGEVKYVWIWARPVTEYYKEVHESCYGSEYTGNEEFVSYVQSIIVNGNWISGDVASGMPSWMSKWVYNNSISSNILVKVTGTPLDDGVLSPNESISFSAITTWLDTCSVDLEFGLDLGIVAAALSPYTGGVSVVLAPLLAQFGISFHVTDSGTVYVNGVLQNVGSSGCEVIYLRMSNLQYRKDPPWWCFWCSPCYYKVPVSMLFTTY